MDEAQSKRRDYYLRRVFGVTLDEWELVLAAQGGGCAGCDALGVTRSLHTDHSHKTDELRGIVCIACNATLSKAKDNPHTLRRLADYLEDPPFPRVLGEVRRILVKPKRRYRRRRRSR